MTRSSGPILAGGSNQPKRLFFFDRLDPAALELDKTLSPGFWPKPAITTTVQAAKQQPPKVPSQGIPRTRLATWLFVAWAIIGSCVAFWFWFITRFAADSRPFNEKGWLDTLFWNPLRVDDTHYSLLIPYLIVMASIGLLTIAAGLSTKGLWFGAVIDERNRFSLSRTQQVAWSILLLGSLGIMSWVNATSGLIDSTSHPNLIPVMDLALWAALGINLAVSPFISDTVLSIKDEEFYVSQAAPAGQAETTNAMIQPAPIDRNETPQEASWTDLIKGETAGTQDQLDISRLQHLIISGLLLTTYFIEVVKKVTDLPVGKPLTPFSEMPHAGNTFLLLLSFSHAGYLVKARKKGEVGKEGEGNKPAAAN